MNHVYSDPRFAAGHQQSTAKQKRTSQKKKG